MAVVKEGQAISYYYSFKLQGIMIKDGVGCWVDNWMMPL